MLEDSEPKEHLFSLSSEDLQGNQLAEQFHLTVIKELCQVVTEDRIFPLLELDVYIFE